MKRIAMVLAMVLVMANSALGDPGYKTQMKVCTEFPVIGGVVEVCNEYPWLPQPKTIAEIMVMNDALKEKLQVTPVEPAP